MPKRFISMPASAGRSALLSAAVAAANPSPPRPFTMLSSSGRVREIMLSYRISFRLHNRANKEYIPTSEILMRRDLSYRDTDVIAKEHEESLLYRDMQSDAVQQLMRRLQATRIDS